MIQRQESVVIDTKLRLYITLRKVPDSSDEYKKLVLMIDNTAQVSDLKRRIEREFAELFPVEPPYVVAKIEDKAGFALSNQSQLGDVCANAEPLFASPEAKAAGKERF